MPIAADDSIHATEDTAFVGSVAGNDTLSGDGGNVFTIDTGPTQGSVTMNADGSFTYTPDANYHGSDSFVYQLADADGDSSSATVSINIAPNPTVPGDINGDSQLSAEDIDALAAGLSSGSNDNTFDVNGDGVINIEDYDYLIETIFRSRRGDADLDGEVDFTDFLLLSESFGKEDSGWEEANFDGDEETSFADFLVLSSNFGWKRSS